MKMNRGEADLSGAQRARQVLAEADTFQLLRLEPETSSPVPSDRSQLRPCAVKPWLFLPPILTLPLPSEFRALRV